MEKFCCFGGIVSARGVEADSASGRKWMNSFSFRTLNYLTSFIKMHARVKIKHDDVELTSRKHTKTKIFYRKDVL